MNKERLLNVAKALRESPDPAGFTMSQYHMCGTPACALGHYAARHDLQDAFELGKPWGVAPRGGVAVDNDGRTLEYCGELVCEHFDITPRQATQLFSDGNEDEDDYIPVGCGDPQSAIEAAGYIENFVARDGDL